MNKIEKMIIAILCIVIVIIIVVVIFGKNESKNINSNNVNLNKVANNVTENNENNENNENENEIENVLTNNVEENIIENITKIEPQGIIYETGANHGTTDKKQQAINLVKEKWGEDNTVIFRCDSVTSEGEYIIAVVSTQTASVKNYFRVNLAHETVTIEY